jgi:pimeloyl-ACP methyl ester carboxylesterase
MAATVRSTDGTPIAYESAGSGPALVLVDGALCYRAMGPSGALAKALAPHFTVFTYDRRGRGESGNREPYAVERELEDLAAVVTAAGGSVFACGVSSGAVLALEAANRGLAIRKLALYEAPLIVDATRTPLEADYLARLKDMIARDRRGDAVRYFMAAVQVPKVFVWLMTLAPAWSKLKATAPTLVYDLTLLDGLQFGRPLPPGQWSSVRAPTLVIDGGKSPVWMHNAQRALAATVPGATTRTLPGQTHMVNAKALAPVLVEFFVERTEATA